METLGKKRGEKLYYNQINDLADEPVGFEPVSSQLAGTTELLAMIGYFG